MASTPIFQHRDGDDETILVVRDRETYLKASITGPTSFTFLDPTDVIALRDALSAAIERNGWAK